MGILGCTVALQCNLDRCLLHIYFATTHNDRNRGNISEELEKDTFFHFSIQIFISLYGDNFTPQ